MDSLQPDFLIDSGHCHSKDFDWVAVSLGCDLLALTVQRSAVKSVVEPVCQKRCNILIEPNVIVLHLAPMPPLERYRRGAAVHFEHFPRERWHHAFESLVAGGKV